MADKNKVEVGQLRRFLRPLSYGYQGPPQFILSEHYCLVLEDEEGYLVKPGVGEGARKIPSFGRTGDVVVVIQEYSLAYELLWTDPHEYQMDWSGRTVVARNGEVFKVYPRISGPNPCERKLWQVLLNGSLYWVENLTLRNMSVELT